jgi:hypothetical protein
VRKAAIASYAVCPFDDCPGEAHARAEQAAFDRALVRIRQRAELDIASLRQRVSLVPYAIVIALLLTVAFFAGWFANSALSPIPTASVVGSGTDVTTDSLTLGDNAVRADPIARGLSLGLPAAAQIAVPPTTPEGSASHRHQGGKP